MTRYSVAEAARLLQVTGSRVRQRLLAMIADGYPEPEKFGGSWLLTEGDLAALKRRRKKVGRPPKQAPVPGRKKA
jgi:Mn-dependent DtxR family transcriptional regulator